jgi:hypothetical protein
MACNRFVRALTGLFLLLCSLGAGAQVVISNVYTSADTATTITITWTTNVPSNSSIKYGQNGLQYQTRTDIALVTTHVEQITLLMAGPVYSAAPVSTDASGNTTQGPTIQFALCGSPTEAVQGNVNNFYNQGPYTITWNRPAAASGITPTACGLPVQETVTGNLDFFGSFSTLVGDSLKIRPGPGNWTVHVTDLGNLSPISIVSPLSQVTYNLDNPLKAAAALAGLNGCISNILTARSWPPACAGSGGGTGPLLETNAVPNFIQTILNLENGNMITVTNTDLGNVRFDFTGTIPPAVTFQTNSINNQSQILLNLVQQSGITLNNPSGGEVDVACTTTTNILLGCSRPDNTTITVSSGVLTANLPTFQTNGTNNLAQNYLDLDAGTNVTLTNTSGGHVRIDATGGGGGSTVIEVNGIPTTPVTPVNFNNTTPAAPNATQNCLWQQSTSPADVSCYVPNPQVAMFVPQLGTANQIILRPTSYTTVVASPACQDPGPYGVETPADAGGLNFGGDCGRIMSVFGYQGVPGLPSFVPPASVTGISVGWTQSFQQGYFFSGPSSGNPLSAITVQSFSDGTSTFTVPVTVPLTTSIVSTSIAAANIPLVTASINLHRSSSISSKSSAALLTMPDVFMVVQYTGPPPPGYLIQVAPPLTLAFGVLGVDPNFPQQLNPTTVAALPAAASANKAMAIAEDCTAVDDCTSGGGTNVVPVISNGQQWNPYIPNYGIPQSPAGACFEGINGNLTNVNCDFGSNLFVQPTIVQSGTFVGSPSCSATMTTTAGNAMVIIYANGSGTPTITGGTFVNIFNINSGTQVGYVATNLTGGSTTINASLFATPCAGYWMEIHGVNNTTPVQGTPATFYQLANTPTHLTLGNVTTTAENGLMFATMAVGSCTSPLAAVPSGYLAFLGSYDPSIQTVYGTAVGAGVYNVKFITNPACVGVGAVQQAYSLFALQGAAGSGAGGVTSINSTAGAFTFTGSGVSCTGTTCTFSGGVGTYTVETITCTGTSCTLSFTPTTFINLARNGLVQRQVTDFTVSGTTVTLTTAAGGGDVFYAQYYR